MRGVYVVKSNRCYKVMRYQVVTVVSHCPFTINAEDRDLGFQVTSNNKDPGVYMKKTSSVYKDKGKGVYCSDE